MSYQTALVTSVNEAYEKVDTRSGLVRKSKENYMLLREILQFKYILIYFYFSKQLSQSKKKKSSQRTFIFFLCVTYDLH